MTREQLAAALRKADAAGNVEDARRLAGAIRSLDGSPAQGTYTAKAPPVRSLDPVGATARTMQKPMMDAMGAAVLGRPLPTQPPPPMDPLAPKGGWSPGQQQQQQARVADPGNPFNPRNAGRPDSVPAAPDFGALAERAGKSIGGMIGGQRPNSEDLAQFGGDVVTDPVNAANTAIEVLDPFHQAAYAYNDADAALKAGVAGDWQRAGNELKDLSQSASFAAMSFLPGAEFAGAPGRMARAAGVVPKATGAIASAAPEAVAAQVAPKPPQPMFTGPPGPAPSKGNFIVRRADQILGGAVGATVGGTGDALAAPGDGSGDEGGLPTGAISGAAIGIFGPRALANASSRGFRAAARPFRGGASFDERVAAKAVREALRSAGIRSADEAAAQMAARYGDKPAAVADLTQEGVGTAAGLSRLPGRTGETANARYADLQQGKMGRLEGDLGAANPNLNPSAIAGDFDGMIKAAQEQAKPLYDGLRAKYKTLDSPRLQYLSEVDAIAPYVRGVQEYRTALQQTTGREITDFEFWDLVKRDIDAKESGLAAKGVPKNDIRFQQIENARTSIVDELDALMPEYAAAREMGGEAPKMRAAFGQGEKLLGGKASIEDVGRAVAGVTGQPLTAMQAGVIRSIVGKIENTKGAVQALTSPGAAAKMEKVFGREATDQIQARFRADAAMIENAGRINPNVGSVSSQAAMGGGGVGGMIAGAVRAVRNPTEAGLSWLSKSGAYSKQQRDIMGEMLLEGTTPENLQRIFRGRGGPTAPGPKGPPR